MCSHVGHTACMHHRTTAPGFHDPARHSWDSHHDQWQRILNERPIPRRRLQHDCWVPVQARLVWEVSGVEYRDTIAYAWAPRRLVLVEVLDPRRWTHGVWLHVTDAPRRTGRR